jgi:hypothetical protein
VDPALAARLPFEVLDDVRDVDRRAVDPGRVERLVEKAPGGADERPAGAVLGVARLLADEHDLGRLPPLSEDGLRAGAPEITGLAARCCAAQALEARALRDELGGGTRLRRGGHGFWYTPRSSRDTNR